MLKGVRLLRHAVSYLNNMPRNDAVLNERLLRHAASFLSSIPRYDNALLESGWPAIVLVEIIELLLTGQVNIIWNVNCEGGTTEALC